VSAQAFHVRAAPLIAVVGDSHAMPFVGTYVTNEAGQTLATTSVANVPGLTAADFLDPLGRIGPRIVAALAQMRLVRNIPLRDPPDAFFIANDVMDAPPEWGWERDLLLGGTPLLFTVGEINARSTYLAIPHGADIPTAFPPEALSRVPSFEPTAIVQPQTVEDAIETQLSPVFRALMMLRRCGIGPIALHSISPCSTDDALVSSALGGDSQALTRTKVIMLFNAAMRRGCERDGHLFIDRWADFTDGGLAREGYLADTVHVGTQMRESIALLYGETLGASRPVVRGARTTLRRTTIDDLGLLESWFGNPEFVQWWGGTPKTPDEVARECLGRAGNGTVQSFLVLIEDMPIGYIQARNDTPLSGRIDIVLNRNARRKGYGPDAVAALARHLRDDLGWTRITVDPVVNNREAISGFKKAGFLAETEGPNPLADRITMAFAPAE
jgi:aminoglycoside 6'-N-acetyltransferase